MYYLVLRLLRIALSQKHPEMYLYILEFFLKATEIPF